MISNYCGSSARRVVSRAGRRMTAALLLAAAAQNASSADISLPVAVISATPKSGPAPLTVSFDASGCYVNDPNYYIIGYDWHLGDGSPVSCTNPLEHTYATPGTYVVSLVAVENSLDGTVMYLRGDTTYDTIRVTGMSNARTHACRKTREASQEADRLFDLCGRAVAGIWVSGEDRDAAAGSLPLRATHCLLMQQAPSAGAEAKRTTRVTLRAAEAR